MQSREEFCTRLGMAGKEAVAFPPTNNMHNAHYTLHIAQRTMHNGPPTTQHTVERETYCSEILQQVIIEHHTCEHVPSRFAHQCKNYSRFAHQCKNYSIPVARGPAPKQYKCGPGDRSKPRIRDVIRSIASHNLDPGSYIWHQILTKSGSQVVKQGPRCKIWESTLKTKLRIWNSSKTTT